MPLSLIMFDCDGVLIESVDAKTRAFGRVGAEYGQKASEKIIQFHNENGGLSRIIKLEWMFKEVIGREPKEGEIESLCDKFAQYSLDEVLHSQPVKGVLDVLKRWKGVVPMYVASGAPHDELNEVLKEQGMSHYFDGVYGSPPGKTDLLRRILKDTGIPASQAIMIGDASTDQYAAEAVNCAFYGRGQYFKHSGYPWHDDLTKLNDYLEAFNKDEI